MQITITAAIPQAQLKRVLAVYMQPCFQLMASLAGNHMAQLVAPDPKCRLSPAWYQADTAAQLNFLASRTGALMQSTLSRERSEMYVHIRHPNGASWRLVMYT